MKVNLKQGKLEMNEWPDQVIVNLNVYFQELILYI